jgi:hypothetical protein
MFKLTLSLATLGVLAGRLAFAADVPSWYPRECNIVDHCTAVENIAWVTGEGARTCL